MSRAPRPAVPVRCRSRFRRRYCIPRPQPLRKYRARCRENRPTAGPARSREESGVAEQFVQGQWVRRVGYHRIQQFADDALRVRLAQPVQPRETRVSADVSDHEHQPPSVYLAPRHSRILRNPQVAGSVRGFVFGRPRLRSVIQGSAHGRRGGWERATGFADGCAVVLGGRVGPPDPHHQAALRPRPPSPLPANRQDKRPRSRRTRPNATTSPNNTTITTTTRRLGAPEYLSHPY
jgi:hypothetical protein